MPGAGRSSLLDGLQALDATRSYVPGSLWAGLANGRGNFTDGVPSMFKVFHGVARQLDALQPDRTAGLYRLDTELVAPAASNTCSSLQYDPARLPKPAIQQCLLASTAVCMQCRAAYNDMQPAYPGPYEIQEPERFFLPDFYNFSFNPEVATAA